MLFDTFHHFTPQDFVFKIARTREELDGYWALRRSIFCEEQGIFQGSDRDAIDEHAIPIVCESLIAGMEDSVVGGGADRSTGARALVWEPAGGGGEFPEREAAELERGGAESSAGVSGARRAGAGLIYKAVSMANKIGCHEFLATVQHQNARFFQRLHWEPLEELELFGIQHVKMRADLEYYRPAESVF